MKKQCLCALAFTVAVAASTPRLFAQAVATATGNALAIGVSYQNIDPDYAQKRASGIGIFANYDFARYVGATAEINLQTAFSNVVFLEHTYFVGARGEYRRGRGMLYGKALIGGGTSSNNTKAPLLNAPGTYPAFAIGGGYEYKLQNHFTIRAIDFERQEWLSYSPNHLTPYVFSFGAAYRLR